MKFGNLYQSKKSRARLGRIHTPHGIIETPNFVPVGTNACVKSLDSQILEHLGVQLMFCNTYHLMLQPGSKVVQEAGGLHKFMNRGMPIITDSGGFQVFSLAYGSVASELKSQGTKKTDGSVLKITEDGVLFRSYRDGAKIFLTAESSIQAQKELGADIMISFDELPPYHMKQQDLSKSLDRTHRWEKRSLDEHLRNTNNQALYAVVHGGVDVELRKKSCAYLGDLPFDGFGIGGSLGKNRPEMLQMLQEVMPFVPKERPNHLLGIGDLTSIDACIPLGVDTFDSAFPTRAARHGSILMPGNQHFNITRGIYAKHFRPLVDDCRCYTCQNHTAAYIHHLFKAHELTALSLTSIHNLHIMIQIMAQYRQQIADGTI
ncbi:MAG: tRNA-guanosine(34) transglycosylase [Deltaproteobacteria bacterium]|nr:tRNA-guanosine(34) transglycosylase [Deltaproteobacteria bacterium]